MAGSAVMKSGSGDGVARTCLRVQAKSILLLLNEGACGMQQRA